MSIYLGENPLSGAGANTDLSNLTATGESHFAKPSDLNGKANTDYSNCSYTPMRSDVKHITETYINGTNWYRVYSDGWCEQGGTNTYDSNVVITLLKPYRDTNYSVIATPASANNKNSNYSGAVGTRTTTQFNISFSNSTTGNSCNHWRAYGYIS